MDELIQISRSHGEWRDYFARSDILFCVCNASSLDEINDAITKHLRVNTKVFVLAQIWQNWVWNTPNTYRQWLKSCVSSQGINHVLSMAWNFACNSQIFRMGVSFHELLAKIARLYIIIYISYVYGKCFWAVHPPKYGILIGSRAFGNP